MQCPEHTRQDTEVQGKKAVLACGTVLCSFEVSSLSLAFLVLPRLAFCMSAKLLHVSKNTSVFSYSPLDPGSPADMENILEVLVSSGCPELEF